MNHLIWAASGSGVNAATATSTAIVLCSFVIIVGLLIWAIALFQAKEFHSKIVLLIILLMALFHPVWILGVSNGDSGFVAVVWSFAITPIAIAIFAYAKRKHHR